MKIKKRMTIEKKNNKMNLSASAFNSCMIEFSIPDFNATIIKNIISLFLSFSNSERREVVFHTQWFIGQYCSERGERVPLSLYERTSVAVLHFYFMTACYYCIPQTPGKSRRRAHTVKISLSGFWALVI